MYHRFNIIIIIIINHQTHQDHRFDFLSFVFFIIYFIEWWMKLCVLSVQSSIYNKHFPIQFNLSLHKLYFCLANASLYARFFYIWICQNQLLFSFNVLDVNVLFSVSLCSSHKNRFLYCFFHLILSVFLSIFFIFCLRVFSQMKNDLFVW